MSIVCITNTSLKPNFLIFTASSAIFATSLTLDSFSCVPHREKKSLSTTWRNYKMKGSLTCPDGLPPLSPCLSPDQPASSPAHLSCPNSRSRPPFLSRCPLTPRTAALRTRPSRTAAYFRQTAWQRSWLVHLKVCSYRWLPSLMYNGEIFVLTLK